MIIDFTVENYRSIKDAVTLSAVAPSRAKTTSNRLKKNIKPDSEIAPTYVIEGRDIELLPTLAIFGANASGKTNVLRALDDLLSFMRVGATEDRGVRLMRKFIPFKLNKEMTTLPTRFELRVARENTIFTYSLVVKQNQILLERLEYIPPPPKRKLNRLLFERNWSEDKQKYIWKNGPDFGNAFIEIQESLQVQAPFMSLLITTLKVDLIAGFVKWMSGRWPGLTLGNENFDYWLTTQLLGGIWTDRQCIVTDIVKSFDTGVTGIKFEQLEQEGSAESKEFQVLVEHQTDDKPVLWQLEDESTGTQRLFTLACKVTDALPVGTLVLVDELGSNIHPLITRMIVRMFQRSDSNPKGAQLIFTSHDNTLQRSLLRRDQIWFTTKQEDGSTELYPLSEFHPRNDLAIDKAYLDGRFGGVPITPTEDELVSLAEID